MKRNSLVANMVALIRGNPTRHDALMTTADLGYGFRQALIQKPIINAADPARYVPLMQPLKDADLGGFIPLRSVSVQGDFPVFPGNEHMVRLNGAPVTDGRGMVLSPALNPNAKV